MRQELLTLEIIKMAKSLKRQIVEITPHYICGSDSLMGMFSIIYLDGNVQVDPELYYFGPTSFLGDYDYYIENESFKFDMLKPKMRYLMAQSQMVENNPVIIYYDDITKGQDYAIDNFVDTINGKAKDGMKILHFEYDNKHFISTSSTMHPINKPDKVSVTAYPYNEISYIAKFTIYKKKYVINEYMALLYLNSAHMGQPV